MKASNPLDLVRGAGLSPDRAIKLSTRLEQNVAARFTRRLFGVWRLKGVGMDSFQRFRILMLTCALLMSPVQLA